MDRGPIEIYSSSETENGYLLQLSLDLSAFAGKFPNFSFYRRYPRFDGNEHVRSTTKANKY